MQFCNTRSLITNSMCFSFKLQYIISCLWWSVHISLYQLFNVGKYTEPTVLFFLNWFLLFGALLSVIHKRKLSRSHETFLQTATYVWYPLYSLKEQSFSTVLQPHFTMLWVMNCRGEESHGGDEIGRLVSVIMNTVIIKSLSYSQYN